MQDVCISYLPVVTGNGDPYNSRAWHHSNNRLRSTSKQELQFLRLLCCFNRSTGEMRWTWTQLLCLVRIEESFSRLKALAHFKLMFHTPGKSQKCRSFWDFERVKKWNIGLKWNLLWAFAMLKRQSFIVAEHSYMYFQRMKSFVTNCSSIIFFNLIFFSFLNLFSHSNDTTIS